MTNLFIEYYKDSSPERQAEYDLCLQKNINNPHIHRIFISVETEIPLPQSEKIYYTIGKRPTFATWMRDMDNHSKDINIIANSDIYFDETIQLAIPKSGQCFAITRHENGHVFQPAIWSQDVWVFNGSTPIISADFTTGIPGCDNRLAYLLAEHYEVINPAHSIHCHHVHATQKRNYQDAKLRNKQTIHGPYRTLTPTAL